MRGAEELAKDIDKFTLESFIRYTERSGDKIIYKTERVPMDKGIPALHDHIRNNWTIREITHFKSFTHGGKFSPPDGSWTINYAGYVAETAEGMGNLIRLFDSLHAEVWAYMGAMLFVNKDAKQHNMNLLQNADDLMDNTLIALIKKLPPKYSNEIMEFLKRIDHNTQIAAASKLKDLQAKSKGGKKTATIKKAERGGDNERKAILDNAKSELAERDKKYPDPESRPQEKSNNAIYQNVANKHLGAEGKPIMSAGAIKKALDRGKHETRGKYNKAGKKRGAYNTK